MRKTSPAIGGIEGGRCLDSKICRQFPESKMDKRMDFPLEPPKRSTALPKP